MFDNTSVLPRQTIIPTIPVREIGFDFDGVIADTAAAFIHLACSKYGYCSFCQEDITHFELENCLNIPGEVVEQIFTDILTDSLTTGVLPIAGAVECLEQFTLISQVSIITARPLHNPVFDWLDRYLSRTARQNMKVVATGDHDDKVRHIHEHKLKYFIDDRAETCTKLVLENITPFVFTQPWNRNQHSLQMVADWQEIRALVSR